MTTTTPNADALSALLSETLMVDVKRFPAVACADIRGCEDIDDIQLTDIQQCVAASAYDALLSKNAALAAENERLRGECNEQARCNGMGSEREARLMAELSCLRRAVAGARWALGPQEKWLRRVAARLYERCDYQDSNTCEEAADAIAAQLRTISSIGDLPAGEEG